MPELPEVETIKRSLEKVLLRKEIENVEVLSAKVVKKPRVAEFINSLRGKSFNSVYRRGKFLIFGLSSGDNLIIHLKMSGQLVWGLKEKESRVIFSLSDGRYLNFKDKRLLGGLWLMKEPMALPLLKAMGPEPLDGGFDLVQFQKRLEKRRAKIKPLLMDQRFIAGLGNLYAAEALFRAKIHPSRLASTLTLPEVRKLFSAIKTVLQEALEHRGSSIDSYVDGEGMEGEFGERLRVYGRRGEHCFRCKGTIERIALGGRGTYFCPRCQR